MKKKPVFVDKHAPCYFAKLKEKALFENLSWAITHSKAIQFDRKFYRLCEEAGEIQYPSDFECLLGEDGYVNQEKLVKTFYFLDGMVYAQVEIESKSYWLLYGKGYIDSGRMVFEEIL